mmetsp:Transcript_79378/g.125223  ORF Transcript_79378/g.125223 Transcript_79378/m.125223 type:complete len:176 (+) Transcript_79378:47-574(+)
MSEPAPVSRAAALQMEGYWASARLQSMTLEKQMLEMIKKPVIKRLMEDLQKTRYEVGYYQDRIPYKKDENEMTRSEIESLRSQKAILEETEETTQDTTGNTVTSETLDSLDPICPCFRVSTRDIDGGAADSGYLSVVKRTTLVAISLEEDYFYGNELHRPSNRGWFPVSATTDLR